jgi:hypothetical protein
LGNEMLTFSFSTACLYWANSHEVHKSKTDSWVTAVIVGAVGKTRVSSPVLSRMITPMLGSHSIEYVNCNTCVWCVCVCVWCVCVYVVCGVCQCAHTHTHMCGVCQCVQGGDRYIFITPVTPHPKGGGVTVTYSCVTDSVLFCL